jgi:glycerol-3-phosphate acyltransferase PlsY
MEISETGILGVVLAASYVAGATPFGYLAGKLRGIDIREHGSGNVGATNVIRVLGKGLGIPVFAADFCKGLLPVMVAGSWARSHGLAGDWPGIVAAAGAVLGHNFPFWRERSRLCCRGPCSVRWRSG